MWHIPVMSNYTDLKDNSVFRSSVRISKTESKDYDLSLIMLPDGLYTFSVFHSPTLPILGTGKPAQDNYYLLYRQITLVGIQKAHEKLKERKKHEVTGAGIW